MSEKQEKHIVMDAQGLREVKEPPQTFRISKVKAFVDRQVAHMEHQQRTIEEMRKLHGKDKADEIMAPVIYNQIAWWNYTVSLCLEFGLPLPVVLGFSNK